MRARLDDYDLSQLSASINTLGKKAAKIAKDESLFSGRVANGDIVDAETIRAEAEKFIRKYFPSYFVMLRETTDIIRRGYIEGLVDDKEGEIAAAIDEVKNTIVTAVIGDNFLAKTPLAMHQYKRQVVSRTGSKIEVSYDWTYGRILREIIFDNMRHIPGYREKNVSILHICSEETEYIPDTNNRDIKTLIDAITLPFSGRDSAVSCSIFTATIPTNEVKEGTYLIVSKGFGAVPDIEKMLQFCKLLQNQTEPFLIHLDAVF